MFLTARYCGNREVWLSRWMFCNSRLSNTQTQDLLTVALQMTHRSLSSLLRPCEEANYYNVRLEIFKKKKRGGGGKEENKTNQLKQRNSASIIPKASYKLNQAIAASASMGSSWQKALITWSPLCGAFGYFKTPAVEILKPKLVVLILKKDFFFRPELLIILLPVQAVKKEYVLHSGTHSDRC